MRVFTVGETIDLNTAAAGATIDLSTRDVPFLPNNTVLAVFSVTAPPGTALRLEGRDDPAGAFATLAEVVAADDHGTFIRLVTLTQEIRVNVAGVAGAGETGNVYLVGN